MACAGSSSLTIPGVIQARMLGSSSLYFSYMASMRGKLATELELYNCRLIQGPQQTFHCQQASHQGNCLLQSCKTSGQGQPICCSA